MTVSDPSTPTPSDAADAAATGAPQVVVVRQQRRYSVGFVALAAVIAVCAGVGGAAADSLITGDQIAPKTITENNLADNAVSGRTIKAGSVTAGKLSAATLVALSGNKWLTGTDYPASSLGSNGDWYLNVSSKNLYARISSGWKFVVNLQGLIGKTGATGKTGPSGTAGSAWLTGSGAPDSGTGAVGDWYLDNSTGDAYTKTSAGWTKQLNLQGIQGADGLDGATWYTGTGAPTITGNAGDLYLDTATSDVYTYAGGAWSLLTNIKGAQGDPGIQGDPGAQGNPGTNGSNGSNGTNGATWLTGAGAPADTTGNNGDLYLNTTNGDVYKKAAGTWGTPTGTLAGPAGTTWRTGSGAPSDTVGSNGDFYLNTATGAIYQKTSGTWGTALYTPLVAGATVGLRATKTTGSQVLANANGTNTGDLVSFDNVVASNSAVGTYDTATSTFTVAQTGLYEVQATTRAVDNATPTSTLPQYLYADIDNGGLNAVNTPLPIYPTVSNTNFPAGSKGRGFVNVTVYLTAGQKINIKGLTANTSTAGTALKTDGSCQLLIVKL